MWGCGENGRIGLGDERYRTVPTVVRNLRDVIIAGICTNFIATA
jgi:alpha-tubulin suppressor-like RCC1 family protein